MKRRYRYNEETKKLEEVSPDYTSAERRAPVGTEAITYGGLQASDGTPIDTRRRHREYLKEHNAALASDYTNTWTKAAHEREEGTPAERKSLREDMDRALHNLNNRRR